MEVFTFQGRARRRVIVAATAQPRHRGCIPQGFRSDGVYSHQIQIRQRIYPLETVRRTVYSGYPLVCTGPKSIESAYQITSGPLIKRGPQEACRLTLWQLECRWAEFDVCPRLEPVDGKLGYRVPWKTHKGPQ